MIDCVWQVVEPHDIVTHLLIWSQVPCHHWPAGFLINWKFLSPMNSLSLRMIYWHCSESMKRWFDLQSWWSDFIVTSRSVDCLGHDLTMTSPLSEPMPSWGGLWGSSPFARKVSWSDLTAALNSSLNSWALSTDVDALTTGPDTWALSSQILRCLAWRFCCDAVWTEPAMIEAEAASDALTAESFQSNDWLLSNESTDFSLEMAAEEFDKRDDNGLDDHERIKKWQIKERAGHDVADSLPDVSGMWTSICRRFMAQDQRDTHPTFPVCHAHWPPLFDLQ